MGDNFGLNDSLRYFEYQLDSLDNSGACVGGVSPLNWPVFLLGGKRPLENIAAIKILEVQIPFSYYVINSGNNTFLLFEEDQTSTSSTVTIPVGNYTPNQICSALGSALSAATLSGHTYTVTYNDQTLKLTITATNVSRFRLSFGASTNSGNINPRLYIGFPGGFTVSSGGTPNRMVSPNAVMLSGPNYIYVNSQKMGSLFNVYLPQGAFNLGGGNAGPQITKVPISSNSGGVIFWQDPDPQKWFDMGNLDQLNSIDFYLTLGNTTTQIPLDLNGLSFSIKLGVLLGSRDRSSSASSLAGNDRVIKRVRLV